MTRPDPPPKACFMAHTRARTNRKAHKTMPRVIAACACCAALWLPSVSGASANACGPRDLITTRLSEKYDEALSAGGLQTGLQKGTMLEIWTSAASGTFTVLITHPTGVSCVVATGEDYFQSDAKAPGIPG